MRIVIHSCYPFHSLILMVAIQTGFALPENTQPARPKPPQSEPPLKRAQANTLVGTFYQRAFSQGVQIPDH
ncbi:hypothetical protein ID852_00845 [Xenorhabdus sp. 42]|uniref:hypothetical protein n=1 Tax=Xenorhabdus szentirmaii TaxID=290112 RepID=UPI00199F8909|nr:hypothetical protein [Xenorhabdus sp. 42]MBD2819264.1 hypothetical protein [Xenorhabdus sp. 42]